MRFILSITFLLFSVTLSPFSGAEPIDTSGSDSEVPEGGFALAASSSEESEANEEVIYNTKYPVSDFESPFYIEVAEEGCIIRREDSEIIITPPNDALITEGLNIIVAPNSYEFENNTEHFLQQGEYILQVNRPEMEVVEIAEEEP